MSLRVEDSILRKIVEREDKFNVIESETQKLNLEMSPPARGIIIDSFTFICKTLRGRYCSKRTNSCKSHR